MKVLTGVVVVVLAACVASCSTVSGSLASGHMRLKDPINRKVPTPSSTSSGALRKACAETMLMASPAVEAKDITAVVASQSGGNAIVEVHAVLLPTTSLGTDRSVAYRCIYQGTELTDGRWTAGLKG